MGAIVITLLLAGCSSQRVMMPTPNIYLDENEDVFAGLHPELKSTEVRIFFITDRSTEEDEEGNPVYGYGRSNSIAFGSAIVDLGENLSWEQLVTASRTQSRLEPVELKLGEVDEILRGPPIPNPLYPGRRRGVGGSEIGRGARRGG